MKIDISQKPKVPKDYNWKIEYHNKIKSFDPKDLVLHLEPKQEKGIKGEVLFERLKDKSLNANALDYLLKHPKLIPEEWKAKYIYFWGTIYRLSDGNLVVRYLCWSGDGWNWSYRWLDDGWRDHSPAALLASDLPLDTENSLSLIPLENRVLELENQMKAIRKFLVF